jgi:uncharacterized integral membrane protein
MERISHWLAWSAVALIVLFAGLNWTALSADTALNLAVMQVQAPMGIILLGLTALFVALFFIATLYSRISNLMDSRRLHKEVRAAQDMADKAEASRLEGLQHSMLTEFRMLNERITRLEAAVTESATPLVRLP